VGVVPGEESKQIRNVQTVLNEFEFPLINRARGTRDITIIRIAGWIDFK
jgi:hypothetical protein